MKREIKFRAWDTEYKEWVTDTLLFYPLSGNVFNTKRRNLGEKSDKNVILMQYTGLRDKHDVEVYEGDILKKDGHRNRIVQWTVDAFTLKQIPEKDGDNPYRMKDFIHGAEVIGDIYQNPELV